MIWPADGIKSFNAPRDISLLDFRDLNDDNQQFLIDTWKFQETLDRIGRAEFFEKLKHVSDRVLMWVKMSDLKADPKSSLLKYALLSDAEFEKLSLRDASHATDDQFNQIICPRS